MSELIAFTPPNMTDQTRTQAMAWLNAPVTRLYTNGFAIAQSNTDLTLVMLANGAPAAIASMSFISAKTLMEELQKAIKILEQNLGQPIPTMEEVAAKMTKAQSQPHG